MMHAELVQAARSLGLTDQEIDEVIGLKPPTLLRNHDGSDTRYSEEESARLLWHARNFVSYQSVT